MGQGRHTLRSVSDPVYPQNREGRKWRKEKGRDEGKEAGDREGGKRGGREDGHPQFLRRVSAPDRNMCCRCALADCSQFIASS